MESLTLDREAAHLKDELMPKYANMVYNGFWLYRLFYSSVLHIQLYQGRLQAIPSNATYPLLAPPKGLLKYHPRKRYAISLHPMESLTLDREAAHLKDELMPKYANMVYNGFWFAPEREMLQAAIDQTQEVVNGEVRLKFYKVSSTYSALSGASSGDTVQRHISSSGSAQGSSKCVLN
jgi:argininosuccinate synthase